MHNDYSSSERPAPAPEPSLAKFDANGYIEKGEKAEPLAGKIELLRLLKNWLEASNAPTIGGCTFGRTAWIVINLDNEVTAVLNADTKRVAVKEYVEDALARGADTAWTVVANRDGTANKLVFREDQAKTPGWYCYSQRPLSVGLKV